MLHGYIAGVYDRQSGPRGGGKTFSESMFMAMGQKQIGPGTLTLRTMLSLDPLMGKSGYPLLLQTGETADGWLGNAFIPEAAEVFLGPLREGAQQAGRTLDQLDLVAPVAVEFHDDHSSADAAARRHADGYAFTIGAMGSGGQNFYNDAFTRLGYGTEVGAVTELWQAGKHDEARRSVPLDLGRLTNLLGTSDTIAERVGRYRAAGITTLLAKLEGGYEQQLTTLQRLVAIAETA